MDPPPKAERDRGKKESREQQALLMSKWPLAFPATKQDIRPLAIGATDEIATTMGVVRTIYPRCNWRLEKHSGVLPSGSRP